MSSEIIASRTVIDDRTYSRAEALIVRDRSASGANDCTIYVEGPFSLRAEVTVRGVSDEAVPGALIGALQCAAERLTAIAATIV